VLAQGQEGGDPVVLPEITVVARWPPYDPARESGSLTVLDRDALASSEGRELNGVLRGLPGVILQTPGSRGTLSGLFVRGASADLGQLRESVNISHFFCEKCHRCG
jgi:outer membrane cobalamin receptor